MMVTFDDDNRSWQTILDLLSYTSQQKFLIHRKKPFFFSRQKFPLISIKLKEIIEKIAKRNFINLLLFQQNFIPLINYMQLFSNLIS